MNDQMPDFEETTVPTVEPLAPKKSRKKPTRRRKMHKAVEIKSTDKRLRVNQRKRRVVKVKTGRRGRPPGSVNKPKAPAEPIAMPISASPEVYAVLASMIALSKAEREQVAFYWERLFR